MVCMSHTMQYTLAHGTIHCIRLRQEYKSYTISGLLRQNAHLSEVGLILGLLPCILDFHTKHYATSSSYAVLQNPINMHMTFDLST